MSTHVSVTFVHISILIIGMILGIHRNINRTEQPEVALPDYATESHNAQMREHHKSMELKRVCYHHFASNFENLILLIKFCQCNHASAVNMV